MNMNVMWLFAEASMGGGDVVGLDPNLIRWTVQVGGPMALLLLVFGYFYRKDMKQQIEQYRGDMKFFNDQMKTVSDEWKGQSAQFMQVIKENTAAFTENAAAVRSLHAHITEGERRESQRHNDQHRRP